MCMDDIAMGIRERKSYFSSWSIMVYLGYKLAVGKSVFQLIDINGENI